MFKAKKWFFSPLTIIILLSVITDISGKEIQSLIIDFKRELIEPNNRELTSGTIYYLSPHTITVIVKTPIHQWMIFGEKKLEIYYPDNEKAFRFKSDIPFQLPFFQSFLGVVKKDYGLSHLGYVLIQRTQDGDTITTIWKPPKKLAKVLGDFTLVHAEDRIILVTSKTPDGSPGTRTSFNAHFKYENTYFPLKISSTTSRSDSDSTAELISFDKPQFNCALPETVIYFTIPPDVAVEEIEW